MVSRAVMKRRQKHTCRMSLNGLPKRWFRIQHLYHVKYLSCSHPENPPVLPCVGPPQCSPLWVSFLCDSFSFTYSALLLILPVTKCGGLLTPTPSATPPAGCQSWHCALERESIRPHRLRAQAHRLPPLPEMWSQVQTVSCASDQSAVHWRLPRPHPGVWLICCSSSQNSRWQFTSCFPADYRMW